MRVKVPRRAPAARIAAALLAACAERTAATPPAEAPAYAPLPQEEAIENVDILFVVDNSHAVNQASLTRGLGALLGPLLAPPVDPATLRPRHPPARSLHLGVVSSDLGTPGSVVPSCANPGDGDDGLLNPIRNGGAMHLHPPWSTAPPGARPDRCRNDPDQYPTFLRFDASADDPAALRDDLTCVAYLGLGGCGLEQPLEAAYRALVTRNPRAMAGNTDPNAGFVRDNAVFALVMVSDEEDGSVRDCRYAERGVPCTDALGVFDIASPQWSSNDLNLRFYLYTPGSPQDPAWPLDRYIDVTRPSRGFTSLKPGRPDLVVFAAIAGVPLQLPMRVREGEPAVDWDALLGRNPDGSDGYAGTSAEGPVSMRQRNPDPACSTRVVPACRREGTPVAATCDPAAQYFAWPARRIAEVVRRFDERYRNGVLGSVCRNDYADTLAAVARRIGERVRSPCLPRHPPTAPAPCEPGDPRSNCARTVGCRLRELLPPGEGTAACTAARGRTPGSEATAGEPAWCLVREVALPRGEAPPEGVDGFYYDTRADPTLPDCRGHVRFTAAGALLPGATSALECARAR